MSITNGEKIKKGLVVLRIVSRLLFQSKKVAGNKGRENLFLFSYIILKRHRRKWFSTKNIFSQKEIELSIIIHSRD